MSLDTIRDNLARWREPKEGEKAAFDREALAAAALMVECARIDRDFSDDERESICRIVRERCGLDSETAESLVSVAVKLNQDVWHDFVFTDAIRGNASPEQLKAVIERLWEVAYVDGKIHPFEAHMIERIGGELGFSKHDVEERRGVVSQRLGREEPEG